MYRDHRKGPGGPPGGATYPGGPHGLKWEGNQPIVGWCAPLSPPTVPRVETLGGGGRPTWLGGHSTPLGRRPPLEIGSPGVGAPPGGLYIVGGREGSSITAPGACLSPCNTSPSRRSSAKPCCDHCCIHHHAVVLLDLHQPLLPPCWIKKDETFSNSMCVERGGAVRSALSHR